MMCVYIYTVSVCIESSSIDLPLEEKAGVGLLEGEGEGDFLGRYVASGSAVFPVWEWSRS